MGSFFTLVTAVAFSVVTFKTSGSSPRDKSPLVVKL